MFQDAKTGTKITLGFAVAILMALVIGISGRTGLTSTESGLRKIGSDHLPSMYAIAQIEIGQLKAAAAMRLLANRRVTVQDLRREQYESYETGSQMMEDGRRAYESLPMIPEERQVWSGFSGFFSDWQHITRTFVNLSREKDALLVQGVKIDDPKVVALDAQMFKLLLQERNPRLALASIVEEIMRVNHDVSKIDFASAMADSSRSQWAMGAALGLGIALSVLIAYAVAYSVRKNIAALNRETTRLTEAAVQGRLQVRGDPQVVSAEFRGVVGGINETLNALIKPLNVAASYVNRLSKGDIPEKISDTLNGDFNTLKNNLNQCIDAVNLLITDARRLAEATVDGNLAIRADASRHQGDFRKVIEGVNGTLDAVIGPLNVAAETVDKISKGNIPPLISQNYSGDFNTLKINLNQCIVAINALVADANHLSQAAVMGRLSARADATQHRGDFRRIVQGFNDTLDAVIGPLSVAASRIDQISKGTIPDKITENYRGDFGALRDNINQCIDAISGLVKDVNVLASGAIEGKLATRADAGLHQGDFRKIIEGINHTLDAVIDPLNAAADTIHRISKGNIPALITTQYAGDFNTIKNNLNQCIGAIQLLIADASILSQAAIEGNLTVRVDASRHQGDFGKIVAGVNCTLDAVIGPLTVAAGYVAQISHGNIPHKITDHYSGDFNTIKTNLNQCIDAINLLTEDAGLLSRAAVEGKLAVRADVSRHAGDFRKVVQGVNDTLDSVIGPLNVAADSIAKISRGDVPPKIETHYSGDFNTIKNNLNECIDAINSLILDAKTLSEAAVEGKLSTRANPSKHQGDFRRIIEGVNATLDAVIGPLGMAASTVDKISKGDIPEKITHEYKGDFRAIKNNLNQCIEAINRLVFDASKLSQAAVEGRLTERADAERHVGDYKKIVQGVNATLDSVIGPLNLAAEYVAKISKGNIPPKITTEFGGEFNTIKLNLNQCVEAVNLLVTDAQSLAQGAVKGQLSVRADATRHAGDFRKIVEGVNQTLDAVIDPILEATQVLNAFANYDLRARVMGDYQGDHARIKTALNGTGTALHDALVQVAEGVEQVSQASRQIAASSQSAAQGASEQASSLEETSSSLEEMAGMTKQNAENTVHARTLAKSTKEVAEKGGQSMARMIDAMERIRTASEGTSQIIKDINEIAFQTNLLALNAAVEAARAGDAGRGFAVVAEEVRNLAQRSKEAAKKTEDLIKVSVGHAENGRSISSEVAGNLTAIFAAAGKVNEIVSEIAVASQEQSRGIEQVNAAVSDMDRAVQGAAADAEQSSSSAEELSHQAEELTQLVLRFQLDRRLAAPTAQGKSRTAEQWHASLFSPQPEPDLLPQQ